MGASGEFNSSLLPHKKELLKQFNVVYDLAREVYLTVDLETLEGSHPSTFLGDKIPDLGAWIIHHLVLH